MLPTLLYVLYGIQPYHFIIPPPGKSVMCGIIMISLLLYHLEVEQSYTLALLISYLPLCANVWGLVSPESTFSVQTQIAFFVFSAGMTFDSWKYITTQHNQATTTHQQENNELKQHLDILQTQLDLHSKSDSETPSVRKDSSSKSSSSSSEEELIEEEEYIEQEDHKEELGSSLTLLGNSTKKDEPEKSDLPIQEKHVDTPQNPTEEKKDSPEITIKDTHDTNDKQDQKVNPDVVEDTSEIKIVRKTSRTLKKLDDDIKWSRILFLGEDEVFNKNFEDMITPMGLECHFVQKREEAIQRMQGDKYFILFLDLRLNVGIFDIPNKLKAQGCTNPIVGVSESWELETQAKAAGMYEYMVIPIQTFKLDFLIREIKGKFYVPSKTNLDLIGDSPLVVSRELGKRIESRNKPYMLRKRDRFNWGRLLKSYSSSLPVLAQVGNESDIAMSPPESTPVSPSPSSAPPGIPAAKFTDMIMSGLMDDRKSLSTPILVATFLPDLPPAVLPTTELVPATITTPPPPSSEPVPIPELPPTPTTNEPIVPIPEPANTPEPVPSIPSISTTTTQSPPSVPTIVHESPPPPTFLYTSDSMTDSTTDRTTDRTTDSMTNRTTDSMTDSMTDRTTDRTTDSTDSMTDTDLHNDTGYIIGSNRSLEGSSESLHNDMSYYISMKASSDGSSSESMLMSPKLRLRKNKTPKSEKRVRKSKKTLDKENDDSNRRSKSMGMNSEAFVAAELFRLTQQFNHLQKIFSAFVPREYQELIAPNGIDKLKLGDTVCKRITVLFSDIRDFTAMSETMYIADLMDFLNTYFAFALPPVEEYGGFVDKFIGDAMMCIFAHQDNQALNSVQCAIRILHNLDFMSTAGFKPSVTGIGINTGLTLIGVLGTETRMEPTSIGDTVNLASRTESLCKQYGARLLITEYTLENMGSKTEQFVIRQIDHVAVKGKNKPCKIYEVIDAESTEKFGLKSKLLDTYNKGLLAFTKGKFQEATTHFMICLETYKDDKPSKLYVERCETMLKMKDFDAATWDGVYKLDTK